MPGTQVQHNHKRYATADLLKGIAVIFMIQVHLFEQFAAPDVFQGTAGKIAAFLGGPPCAPVFLLIMGYFLFSESRTLKYFLKRGLLLLLIGLLLNFARSANLLIHVAGGQSNANPYGYLFGVDILPMAGFSIMLIGLSRYLFKNNFVFYLLLAFAVAFAGPYLDIFGKDESLSAYLNAFLYGNFNWSYFPVLPWFSYVLIGYASRLIIQRYNLLSRYTTSYGIVFSLPLIIFSAFTIYYADAISYNLSQYYHHDLLFFGWVIVFLSGYIMLVHLLENNYSDNYIIRYIKWIGRKVTFFYIVQWIIIGNIATEIFQTQKLQDLAFWFIGIVAITSFLTLLWDKLANAYKKTEEK